MAAYSKEFLTAAPSGLQVPVAATASPGTTVHTAAATAKDEVYLFFCSNHTSAVDVTIQWGGLTAGAQTVVTVPAKSGDYLVIAGRLISGSLTIQVFASVANVVFVTGYVNRVT
jgi:hypothetical protein